MNPRFFLFGAGYSARAFAGQRPENTDISGTTRSPDRFDLLRRSGIEPHLFDGSALGAKVRQALGDVTHVVVSAAPGEAGDPVLRAAGDVLMAMPRLEWVAYLSTVGVYGDHGGEWVDESSACHPVSVRSKSRLAAEQAWSALGERRDVPVAILRLAGIYGPGRNTFVNLEKGTAKRLIKPGQVFNRIHVEDIAGALWHLTAARSGGIFNVTDDEPAPPQDVVAYAAGLMGVEPPPETPFETAELSPMTRSFYGENKRVSNKKLRNSGYALRYPDYRASIRHMWSDQSWR